MKLIGMLDSPYVRRVAISLNWLGIPFEHQALSVFSTYEQFRAINPVVKAPTLVCNDGSVMMDSTAILQYVEALFPSEKVLAAQSVAMQQRLLRCIGLALAACDKSVQLYYELIFAPNPPVTYPGWIG